jgi:hypothetical protein
MNPGGLMISLFARHIPAHDDLLFLPSLSKLVYASMGVAINKQSNLAQKPSDVADTVFLWG